VVAVKAFFDRYQPSASGLDSGVTQQLCNECNKICKGFVTGVLKCVNAELS